MSLQIAARCGVGSFTLDVDVSAEPGDVVAVLGPNGSGKSTLLRAVAGLRPLLTGRIRLGDRTLDEPATSTFVPAALRRVGMVFADHRLFPTMTVLDNVAFGARAQGMPAGRARAGAAPWLTAFGLDGLATRRPHQLSGGQSQRVALARALAPGPEVLLLDEPLAALDVRTRADVQATLAQHVARFGGPTLLVTHDPLEALLLAHRLVVLEAGRVVQTGTPAEVARRPATPYVARVVGVNLWAGTGHGRVVALTAGGRLEVADPVDGSVLIAASPSVFTLHPAPPGPSSARNVWPGRISALAVTGGSATVQVQIDAAPAVTVDVTTAAVAELGLGVGSAVWVAVKASALSAYPAPAINAAPDVGVLP